MKIHFMMDHQYNILMTHIDTHVFLYIFVHGGHVDDGHVDAGHVDGGLVFLRKKTPVKY